MPTRSSSSDKGLPSKKPQRDKAPSHFKKSSQYSQERVREKPARDAANNEAKDTRSTVKDTSWTRAGQWYDSIVGEKGHYYHQELIFPRLKELLELQPGMKLLDIGCGQGILARHIPKGVIYTGFDLAQPLVQQAKRYYENDKDKTKDSKKVFFVHDATINPWPSQYCPDNQFDYAVSILALQNMKSPQIVFQETFRTLKPGGKAIFVINHPYFRIPRQTRWGFDEGSKRQIREIFSYMSHQEIPIITHPGKERAEEATTWSFHYSLNDYSKMIHTCGLHIELIEEWCSPKESYGTAARWENRARKEFPLFMALCLTKPV